MTTISAKIDNTDKNLFETICTSMGINISAAINAFVKMKAADDPYIYSEENMKFLRKSINQIESGNGQVHELKEIPQ